MVPPIMANFERDDDWTMAKRMEITQDLGSPIDEAYEEIGLTMERLARERKRQLNAKGVKHIKVKGILPEGTRLPAGYKVIARTFDLEAGGETLLEYKGVDHGVRLKAADAIERNRGWAGADKVEETSKATIIHVHTHIPEPLPLPKAFQLPDKTDGEDE